MNSTEQNGHKVAIATAHANIALAKYWGKRDISANLPAVGSISLTLDALKTETSVQFDGSLKKDLFKFNGRSVAGSPKERVVNFLDVACGKDRKKAVVASCNNFPASAGLASSASGFAALALAVDETLSQDRSKRELSQLARRGSGSAARSIFGGFVEMKAATDDDYAVELFDENYWDLRMLIAVTSTEEKKVGSTEGMKRTAQTSPYYRSWVEEQPHDLNEMRNAIEQKDFEKLGELAEYSAFKMHGLAMSANPPLLYWNDTTIKVIKLVQDMRASGTAAYVTIDAGPQVKIICKSNVIDEIEEALQTVKGVNDIIACKAGPGASVKSFEKAEINE